MDSVNVEETFEVIVVGAGLSGLTAARQLYNSGINVLVLEARHRVGGRTYTKQDFRERQCDFGGSYIGPSQKHILSLAKELDVDTYDIHEQLPTIYFTKSGSRKLYLKSSRPRFGNPLVYLDLNNFFRLLDELSAEISAGSPWEAPQAARWDKMTVKEFMDKHLWTREAKELIDALCSAVTASDSHEISFLWFLWHTKLCNGTRRIFFSNSNVKEMKFVGGSQQLSEKMAGHLAGRVLMNKPVCEIDQRGKTVIVGTLDGCEYEADRVIVAIPPALQLKIHFKPSLPPLRNQLIQRLPMGSAFKLQICYDRCYWRDKGLCGATFVSTSDEHPVSFTMDDTKPDGSLPALTGFIVGDQARRLCTKSMEEREVIVAQSLATIFRCPEMAKPVVYEDYNWMADQYSGGGYSGVYPPGCMTSYGSMLREPVQRIHFAGTETAELWVGFMDGAISTGKRAAHEVLRAQGKATEDEASKSSSGSTQMLPSSNTTFWERNLPSVSGVFKMLGITATVLSVVLLTRIHHKESLLWCQSVVTQCVKRVENVRL